MNKGIHSNSDDFNVDATSLSKITQRHEVK